MAHRDPVQYRDYMRDYMRERHGRMRKQAVAQLGGKCVVCGSTRELEIDHIDPLKKTMKTNRMWSGQ